jgi:glutamate--cysteine ligase
VPTKTQQLGLSEARALIAEHGFGGARRLPAGPTVGVELESFTVPAIHPDRLPRPELPAGSRLSFEPGGQVELSSQPFASVGAACTALATDLAVVADAFAPLGIELVQTGVSPAPEGRPRHRLVDEPRYQAMEAYFDSAWPQGRAMMRSTASVQVNLGLGGPAHARRRWEAANVLGPLLTSAFASAPPPETAAGPWASPRAAIWLALDPGRTAAVGLEDDPALAWADYALDARVMFIRAHDDRYEPLGATVLRARDWVNGGHPLGYPTADDLAYHLTTLFPPVRPKGWLELRMIDALPDPWWRVPVAAAAVWIDDAEVVQGAEPTSGKWLEAARCGLSDPLLGALASFAARRAVDGLDSIGADPCTASLTEQWASCVQDGKPLPWL